MDFPFLLKTGTEWFPIKNLVVLYSKENAETYLREVFVHYPGAHVVSAEPGFPHDEDLRRMLLEQLAENESLRVVVIGADSLQRLSVKTPCIFVMDSLLLYDCCAWSEVREKFGLNLNGTKLAGLIKTFFEQDKLAKFSFNSRNVLRHIHEYDAVHSSLSLDLLTRSDSNVTGLEI